MTVVVRVELLLETPIAPRKHGLCRYALLTCRPRSTTFSTECALLQEEPAYTPSAPLSVSDISWREAPLST